jgi:membrane-associated phospholipid phosphatase
MTIPDDGRNEDRYVGQVDLTHWYTPVGRWGARTVARVGDRVGPNGALVLTLVIGGAIVLLLAFLASRVYDAVTESDGVAGLDRPILMFAMSLRNPTLDVIVAGFTESVGPVGMPIVAVVAILVLALRRRSWTPVILIAATGIGSLLMTLAGKDIIGRHRPPLSDAVPPYEYSPSFPSGHTLNAVAVVGIIAYLLILRRHRTRSRVLIVVAMVVFALAVGCSRVFLGAHWFTDVLAGWILGAAWLALVITAHRLYLTTRPPKPI